MATSKKVQAKAGVPERRRGQEMGDERSAKEKTLGTKERTPAARGRRKAASKFYADDSSQATGSRGEAIRDNSPSVPAAVPTEMKLGESDGEREFKARRKSKGRK